MLFNTTLSGNQEEIESVSNLIRREGTLTMPPHKVPIPRNESIWAVWASVNLSTVLLSVIRMSCISTGSECSKNAVIKPATEPEILKYSRNDSGLPFVPGAAATAAAAAAGGTSLLLPESPGAVSSIAWYMYAKWPTERVDARSAVHFGCFARAMTRAPSVGAMTREAPIIECTYRLMWQYVSSECVHDVEHEIRDWATNLCLELGNHTGIATLLVQIGDCGKRRRKEQGERRAREAPNEVNGAL